MRGKQEVHKRQKYGLLINMQKNSNSNNERNEY